MYLEACADIELFVFQLLPMEFVKSRLPLAGGSTELTATHSIAAFIAYLIWTLLLEILLVTAGVLHLVRFHHSFPCIQLLRGELM